MPELGRAARLAVAVSSAAALAVLGGATYPYGPKSTSAGGQGGSGGGTSATAPASQAALHWRACGSGGPHLRCGRIQVPLSYADPHARKITLALTEVPAAAPVSQQQGILLVNPGGPGGSGTSLASFVAQGLSPSVAAEDAIIGFDPRGVGASVPSMQCRSE